MPVLIVILCLGSMVVLPLPALAIASPWPLLLPLVALSFCRCGVSMLGLAEGILLWCWSVGMVLAAFTALVAGTGSIDVVRGMGMGCLGLLLVAVPLTSRGNATRLAIALMIGLALSLAAGLSEATELYRFPGSASVLGDGAYDLPERYQAWAVAAPAAGWGNPNNFAACQVVLGAAVMSRGGLWWLALGPLCFVLWKSKCDLAILSVTLIATVVVVGRVMADSRRMVARLLTAVGGAALFVLLVVLQSGLGDRIASVLEGSDTRVGLLKVGLAAIADQMPLGVGPGLGFVAMEAAGSRGRDFYSDSHNQFVSAFLEYGVIGGIGFSGLVALAFVRAVRQFFSPVGMGRSDQWVGGFATLLGLVLPLLFCAASNSAGVWPLYIGLGFALCRDGSRFRGLF